MSTAPALLVERTGPLTRLTLNRPEKRNALSTELVECLLDAVRGAATDGTRLLVIEGAGKGLCAGFDFGGLEEQSDAELVARFIRLEQLLQTVQHLPCATLALAHGASFGAGADLVAACTRRVAALGATFRMPGLRFGVVLGTRRLASLLGADAARGLLATSRVFDVEEAARLGFIGEVREQATWPALVEAALVEAQTLSPAAQAALLARTIPDTRAADMAALVASVAEPGLRARIEAFLTAARSARPRVN